MNKMESKIKNLIAVRLKTHADLNAKDITFAKNIIYQYLSTSIFIRILTYINTKGICKFALAFNTNLDTAIQNKDENEVKLVLDHVEQMFVELYDNPYLSQEERDFLNLLLERELMTTAYLIQMIESGKEITFNDTCHHTTVALGIKNNSDVAAIATKCYEQVCIEESKIDDNIRAVMSKHEPMGDSVYAIDKKKRSKVPKIYCFDLLTLLESLPKNPETGQNFDKYALSLIETRLHKEMAMYRRFKEY